MSDVCKSTTIKLDPVVTYQTIDGFGVNINSKYWNDDTFLPAMQLLVDDLGATIYRLDAYGKSNWIDPNDEFDATILNQTTYDRVYQGREFQNAAAMGMYLNQRGIDPYITLSGIVPRWMCAEDGKTLKDYVSFAEMCRSYVAWLRKQGVRFHLFCPLNETNLGPPEGPFVTPREFPLVLAEVVRSLDRHGLTDINLVVAEQAGAGPEFVREIVTHRNLLGRVHAFAVHSYGDEDYCAVVDTVKGSDFSQVPVWMGEYGELDQSGENEWFFSRLIFMRLVRLLQAGMTAALNWDAFDNYHDHDEAWSIYGIIRTGLRCFTPKKRFHACKQIYRFVPAGWKRVGIECESGVVNAVAFCGGTPGQWTVSGVNESAQALLVRIALPKGARSDGARSDGARSDGSRSDGARSDGARSDGAAIAASGYITDATINCSRVPCGPYRPWNTPSQGYEITVPPHGIFTITTVKA